MFYLHVSNRTEHLLQHLSSLLRAQLPHDLLSPELFLIQSQGMERLVLQHLADDFGCYTNFRFLLPIDFFTYIADRLGFQMSPDGFDRPVLAWRIEALLRDATEPVFARISRYLEEGNRARKRLQLAGRLAHLFDQYQILRPEIIHSWQQGRTATAHPDEKWQQALWQGLFAEDPQAVHRGGRILQVINHLRHNQDSSEVLPQRVSIMGLHTMPPLFVDYLEALSRHMDVHLLLLSPCQHYWGDVVGRHGGGWLRNAEKTVAEQLTQVHHPLLAALGNQGREFLNLLLTRIEPAREFASYAEPSDTAPPKLLHRLQSDILNNRCDSGREILQDDSLAVVSCHSRLRELMVLKDQILAHLEQDPQLALRQIVVMAPDIQAYSGLIPAVFQDLPHSVADRSLRRRNRVVNAFLAFLQLATERCGWQEVMDLLGQEPVRQHFELSDNDMALLREWVVASGIRWGLSADHRQELGAEPFGETSWQYGLDRMLMGYAVESDQFVDGVLPFNDIEGKAGTLVGTACHFLELLRQTKAKLQIPRDLVSWSTIVVQLADQLLGWQEGREYGELFQLLGELAEPAGNFHHDPVEFSAVYEWLQRATEESRSSSGFLRGQLTFCSMLPMRSIPFKIVCLLGLNDGEFPRNDFHDTFDLLGIQHRQGDRSARSDDRYQFLEAILAARSHLYLSYIGQSEKTNEKQLPSVLIVELLEILKERYGVENLVVEHPLHPFSRRYFQQPTEPGLFSYSESCCRIARELQQPRRQRGDWWQGRLEYEAKNIEVAEMFRFYRNPQRYFIRDILGIEQDFGDELTPESEPFVLTGLAKFAAERELLLAPESTAVAKIVPKLQAAGSWPLQQTGLLQANKIMRTIASYREQLASCRLGEACGDLSVDLEIATRKLTGRLANQYENGVLVLRLGKMRGVDLLTAWLHHLIAVRIGQKKQTVFLAEDAFHIFSGEIAGPSLEDFVDLFVDGCSRVSPFYVEAAFAYAKALHAGKGLEPLAAAGKAYQESLEKEFLWELPILFRNRQTAALTAEFAEICDAVMVPMVKTIWR